ncbi:hypothetical protein FDP16_03700 [Streptococcus sanguinis]|uniref:Uncharacterized protein n=1 Tax=Streptococcus sanguinis TaxID=1305 RepID=A0A7H8UZB8_STRSA|nr:hypothetical protein [Streptococcus sanguinis]QLB49715.1 hypothetical protein FDP16_03700 [Streptococcus sanguinis]
MVKLFDLCYSEYAWDSLSKWFIVQFYFTKTIATMQKATAQNRCFFCSKETIVPAFLVGQSNVQFKLVFQE